MTPLAPCPQPRNPTCLVAHYSADVARAWLIVSGEDGEGDIAADEVGHLPVRMMDLEHQDEEGNASTIRVNLPKLTALALLMRWN